MSITKKTTLFFAVLVLALIALAVTLWYVFDSSRTLNSLQSRRYESRLLADELRRSSDDLTRMARTYVVTGDVRFLQYFKAISAIRDGRAPRPDKYENVYWDLVTAQKTYKSRRGKTISIIDKMKALHFSESELHLLQEAKDLSDALMSIETQAFNALQGLFQDRDGKYSIYGKPDKMLAQKLVFGKPYHRAKRKIMERINRCYDLIDARTYREVRDIAELQQIYQAIAMVLSVIIMGLILVGFGLIDRDVIKPLNRLSEWIRYMHRGSYSFDAREFSNNEIGKVAKGFADMASQVASNISNLEHVSETDALTNIRNRSAIDKALLNEMYRFERHGAPCAILMVDIDHFKGVNDRYGHLIGDKVLIDVAKVLTAAIRMSDILGRWGGEEFIIVCPGTDVESARFVAERIRSRIAEHRFDGPGHVTVSIGVGEFEKGKSVEHAVQNADEALYRAKREGRNRVC